MPNPIERVVGKIGRERKLPGTKLGEADEVRYVSFAYRSNPADIFEEVVWKVDPPLATSGGVNLANVILTIPDGTPFYALEYHGDVAGWTSQIEQGAQQCGALSARIDGDHFVLSDSRSYLLSECAPNFVPGPATR
jgi:hypothetical protein